MKAKFWAFAFAAVLVACLTTNARATDDVFTFNVDYCTNPCLGGVPASNNGGTVTLHQVDTNIVDVKVQLASGLFFHSGGLDSFAFNISGHPTLTLVSSLTGLNQLTIVNGGGGTWNTLNQPANNTDGAGSIFMYSLDCTAGSGMCSPATQLLEFQVEASGLTQASFEVLTGVNDKQGRPTTTNVDFAANVANGTCTGMIGAGNGTSQSTAATVGSAGTACGGTTQTPEPGTISVFGIALAGLAAALRRKLFA